MLLRLGCEQAQGYGIARPMPAHEMQAWSAAWRPYPAWLDLTSVSNDDLPLIFAGVEHRASVRAFEECLKEGREIPLPLEYNQCHFGAWLDVEGRARFGTSKAFQSIDCLHKEMHALVRNMRNLQSGGRNQDALACLGQLHGMRDALFEQSKPVAELALAIDFLPH